MFPDKVFLTTIVISLALHGVILLQPANLRLFQSQKKQQEMQVSYLKNLQQIKELPQQKSIQGEPLPKSSPKVSARKPPPPFIDRESIFKQNKQALARKIEFPKPAFVKPDVISVKKKITLPPVELEKINNPVYISYYQIIREKIKRAAYHNYSRSDEGEVYLSFIVTSEGALKEVLLVEEKSSKNPYLKESALKSVKDAGPFPGFPNQLQYQQLSFNVIISFEIE